MDAERLRTCVWEEMLLADMRANYFGELVRSYLAWDKWLRLATLISTSGTFVAALMQTDPYVKLCIPVVASGISLWLFLSQYGTMARDASDLHAQWNKIKRDYERLWNSLDSVHAEEQYHQIYDEAEAYSKSGTKFPNKKDRLEYWLNQAVQIATARYA